jgi:phosphohistidine swiveling domain-containing protein
MANQTPIRAQTQPHQLKPETLPPVVTLAEAAGLDPAQAQALLGTKAANLARLAGPASPVPAGVVVTPTAAADWEQTCTRLLQAAAELTERQGQRFAVRSSATAEDLAGASFAGQYETVLDVALEELPEAVRQVMDSAASARVAAYRQAHPQAPAAAALEPSGSQMAVLVQVMVPADAAGVAFTANPLTGARDEVVVSAVRGLGERLVAGEAVGDHWVVRGQDAACRDGREGAIAAAQAVAIATLARRVERSFGSPQDIEWAIAEGQLFLLQARPMTAVPEPVTWTPPAKGWWLRNFRFGEWLPEPVTPLFADWLLPVLERGMAKGMRTESQIAMRPQSAVVNGWYYTTPPPRLDGSPLPQVVRRPQVLALVPRVLLLLLHPEWLPGQLAGMTRAWREELLPRYQQTVQAAETTVAAASPGELVGLVDRVGEVAGEYAWSVATLAGSQWKLEAALARFCRRHLPGLGDSPQVLVCGLEGTEPDLPSHAVHSIDWYWPTAGQLHAAGAGVDVDIDAGQRHRQLAIRRRAAEAACRAALAGRPRLRRRFERLLAIAQTYAVVREQQTRQFSLGWPLLRHCALRLGQQLLRRGSITQTEDVFFLTRAELEAALGDQPPASLADAVSERRTRWQQQRRLAAPLVLGKAPALGRRVYDRAIDVARSGSGARPPEGALVGEPASPGTATGRVRVILDPADFPNFQPGEVLVARATAPAWTPLFAKAAAVVTDGGTLAAHASLVAREYGIPAVVATGDATTRLRDGQLVSVDGSAGIVQAQP